MFDAIHIDITGGCNAKCPLCSTARETFGQRINFISTADFARTLDRLLDLGLAVRARSTISLFNWGEPILHPDLDGIVAALNARDLAISFSTNASKKTSFTVSTHGFREFTFSVPGWSQASYDKVHGLRFDRVIANMEATLENLRATGFRAKPMLAFHVYQFNAFDEQDAARAWCRRNGVAFFPYYAYINDYRVAKAYRKGEMSPVEIGELSRSLFLHYVDDLVARQPADWECPQWDTRLTLNHKSQVLLCCVVPDTHEASVLGSVFDLSRDEVLLRKRSSKECDDCLGCGVAYWGHNFVPVSSRRSVYQSIVDRCKSADAPQPLRAVVPLARKLRAAFRALQSSG